MHPLRTASLIFWTCLALLQASLLLPRHEIDWYWPGLLLALLLIPLPGLWLNRRYTYKWIGFIALIFFCIGISELAANPALRGYALGTALCSLLLFLASIYHARYLGARDARQSIAGPD